MGILKTHLHACKEAKKQKSEKVCNSVCISHYEPCSECHDQYKKKNIKILHHCGKLHLFYLKSDFLLVHSYIIIYENYYSENSFSLSPAYSFVKMYILNMFGYISSDIVSPNKKNAIFNFILVMSYTCIH